MKTYRRVASLTTAEKFAEYLDSVGARMAFDPELRTGSDSPLDQPLETGSKTVGNRFSILPIEGWDGQTDSNPTELTLRRWKRFGQSGAKRIAGGEAVAVRADGRANPNPLIASDETVRGLEALRVALVEENQQRYHKPDDLLIGLQLTHSGRFSRPEKGGWQSRTVHAHPVLDEKFNVAPTAILSGSDIDELILH
ncbi:MAG: hypothetical protein JNL67_11740 [Planctomycetaceae bacterium]|nr:hypothetical protein [Planctomycetaceae bacterium]